MKNVILDVDTGIDDAVAICYACYCKKINLKLITTVVGNTSVKNSTRNTLGLLELINKNEVKVAEGSHKPIKDGFKINVHGKNGVGEYDFGNISLKPQKQDAVQEMYNLLKDSNEKYTIICLGPVTNLAKLLKTHPKIEEKIETVVISGGLIEKLKKGDMPYISFNIGFDREAMEIVLRSNIKKIICPSNNGHEAYFSYRDIVRIKNTNKTGKVFEFMFRSYTDQHVDKGVATHDLCAVLSYAYPEIFENKHCKVKLDYFKELGTSVLNFDFNNKPGNMVVATQINIKKAKRIFFSALRKMP